MPVIVQISKFFSQDTELKWENNSHDVILRFSTAFAQIATLRKNWLLITLLMCYWRVKFKYEIWNNLQPKNNENTRNTLGNGISQKKIKETKVWMEPRVNG